jgi:hypothetical protein
MSFEYNRNIRDALFATTKAFPAANAVAVTDAFDLEQTSGGTLENVEAEIVIPALPNNSDNTKTITIALHDSADNSSFAATDPLVQTSIVGVTTTGSAAKTVRFRFPPVTRRYVRLSVSVPTGAGDNTAASVGFNLLF